jgi:hypothetical protein
MFLLRISSNGAHNQAIFRVFLQKEAVREKMKNAKPKKPMILKFFGKEKKISEKKKK